MCSLSSVFSVVTNTIDHAIAEGLSSSAACFPLLHVPVTQPLKRRRGHTSFHLKCQFSQSDIQCPTCIRRIQSLDFDQCCCCYHAELMLSALWLMSFLKLLVFLLQQVSSVNEGEKTLPLE